MPATAFAPPEPRGKVLPPPFQPYGVPVSDRLADELATLRELALAAGRELLASLGNLGRVEAKTATEFVTDVDRRVEELVLAGLSRHFPADAVLAEESGDRVGAPGGRTWYIDPLDGTTNFAHGHPIFAFSAGCAGAGGLDLGAVYLPYLDELYLARRGGGATLERPRAGEPARPLARRVPVDVKQSLLATGFPYVRDHNVDRTLAAVGALLKAPCHGIRRGGSAAADLVHVAAGKMDGYFELRLRPWDTAGGTLIAREAGVIVTDLAGVAVAVPSPTIVAAAPGLHAQMMQVLAATAGPEPA